MKGDGFQFDTHADRRLKRRDEIISSEALLVEADTTWGTMSFAVYCLGVLLIVSVMVGLSYLLGERHNERATGEPFESGIPVTGSSRLRFDAKFYLVAMVFVVFDLESVFLFAWSLAVPELGWAGYVAVLLFVSVLLIALVYIWRSGVLNFGPHMRVFGGHREREYNA